MLTAKDKLERKTSIPLEIDQVGSGPMIVAILTGNETLAKYCNLMEGKPYCIYSYVQEKSYEYMLATEPELCASAPEALEFLKTHRKSHKFALMCFFYNQKHVNRTHNFKSKFEEFSNRSIEDSEWNLFSKFSIAYEDFITESFPGLNKQLKLLEDAMLVLQKLVQEYPNEEVAQQALKTAKEISIDLATVDVFATWVKQLKGVTLQDNELERASFTAAERLFNDNKKKAAQKALTSYLENYPQGANQLQVSFLSAELYFQEELVMEKIK